MERTIKISAFVVWGMVLLIFFLNIATSFFNVRDEEWGVCLSVRKVTNTGLRYELKRENGKYKGELNTGLEYWLEKRSLFDWERLMEKSRVSTLEGYVLNDLIAEEINWEYLYGELPMGIYRIGQEVTAQDSYENTETERTRLSRNYYATFFVIDWWVVLLCFGGIISLIATFKSKVLSGGRRL